MRRKEFAVVWVGHGLIIAHGRGFNSSNPTTKTKQTFLTLCVRRLTPRLTDGWTSICVSVLNQSRGTRVREKRDANNLVRFADNLKL